jgi:LAS superfamily LD-carboxypeptidase LdcB
MTAVENGGNYRYNGKYLLHPEAAIQYFKLKKQAKAEGVTWTMTSAYRSVAHQQSLGTGSTIAKPGSSPHGWGIAIDFSELYRQVGGSGNPAINKAGREKSSLYRWLSNNGPKYGWYNPARLADGGGVDEMWHWEYWGFYVAKV